MKTAPSDATIQRRVATLSLPVMIVCVHGIYRNELDKMMTRFKKTQPDFLQGLHRCPGRGASGGDARCGEEDRYDSGVTGRTGP